MTHDIEAVFLDVGNTLRVLIKDAPYQAEARRQIAKLIETQEDPDALCARLDARYKIYRKWAFEHLIEAPENELWTRWLLPEYPPETVARKSGALTYQFRQSMGRRVMVPNAREVVIELSKRGYRLGIISNVITQREIPDWLDQDNLSQYFKSVVLSSTFGRRKPDPAIYLEAARLAEVDPIRCVYVGDNPKRDVVGTRMAGFGMVILMIEPVEMAEDPPVGENIPDRIIHNFADLLDIFPPR